MNDIEKKTIQREFLFSKSDVIKEIEDRMKKETNMNKVMKLSELRDKVLGIDLESLDREKLIGFFSYAVIDTESKMSLSKVKPVEIKFEYDNACHVLVVGSCCFYDENTTVLIEV